MLIAFHKPYGVLSQFTSDGSPNRTLAEFGFPKNVYPIGRLDADSEGLLLLTDEPGLNTRLLHPRNAHEREYWAQVERIPTPEALTQLSRGVTIQGHRTLPCKVWLLDPQPLVAASRQSAADDPQMIPPNPDSPFGVPASAGPAGTVGGPRNRLKPGLLANKSAALSRDAVAPVLPPRNPPIRFRKNVPDCWLALELVEGKNRQVRRMTAAIGHPTLRLVRVRIGRFTLAELPPGQWIELGTAERASVLSGR